MYCEKCGKQNDDGAIFCSNCSSVLRSRRQSSQPAEGETKRFKLPDEVTEAAVEKEPVKPVVNDMPAVSVAVKEKAEKSGLDFLDEEPVRRAPRKKPEPKPAYHEEEFFDEPKAKAGSAWFGVLATVSWIMFIAFAAIGIIGGGYLVLMGLGSSDMLFTYLGIMTIIVSIVIGLAILANCMVKIKIAKSINKLNKNN